MNKVLLVNKEQNYTSRDIVNIVSKKLGTKKVGHFGTLDPLATGLLVIGIGACTKIGNFLTTDDKEYIAEVLVGTATDTYDITGKILKEKAIVNLDTKKIIEVLNSFKKTYLQEVPIYSAVKVNGKKLYEYARNNETVELPKKEVTIKEIKFLESYQKEENKWYFTFKTKVSKGTYIRSLINDISKELKIPLTMSALKRTKQDKFKIEDAYTLEDINNNHYQLLSVSDVLECKIEEITKKEEKKIQNGSLLENNNRNLVLFKKNNKEIVLYGTYEKDDSKIKPYIFLDKEQ